MRRCSAKWVLPALRRRDSNTCGQWDLLVRTKDLSLWTEGVSWERAIRELESYLEVEAGHFSWEDTHYTWVLPCCRVLTCFCHLHNRAKEHAAHSCPPLAATQPCGTGSRCRQVLPCSLVNTQGPSAHDVTNGAQPEGKELIIKGLVAWTAVAWARCKPLV